MYRFGKWIDSTILALITAAVFLIMPIVTNRDINWYSVISVFIATIVVWVFVAPKMYSKR